MRHISIAFSSLVSLVLAASLASAQVGGGAAAYRGNQSGQQRAMANERAHRTVGKDDMPPANSMYLDAGVLMNVRADEFVATFGISQEGATLDEARKAIEATIRGVIADFKGLGAADKDLFVDFVAQNRIYGYEIQGDIAREKLTGFEVKKNVIVHYRDKDKLDAFLEAASKHGVFDLVKVDYIVNDMKAVHARLMQEASKVIEAKAANLSSRLKVRTLGPAQVYAERYAAYYPTDMYDAYTAQEGETVENSYLRQRMAIQGARKNRTFYYNPLDGAMFDHVVGPVITEPVVQFTLYLKVRYGVGQALQPGVGGKKPGRTAAKGQARKPR